MLRFAQHDIENENGIALLLYFQRFTFQNDSEVYIASVILAVFFLTKTHELERVKHEIHDTEDAGK